MYKLCCERPKRKCWVVSVKMGAQGNRFSYRVVPGLTQSDISRCKLQTKNQLSQNFQNLNVVGCNA